jgi:hypothetical protein
MPRSRPLSFLLLLGGALALSLLAAIAALSSLPPRMCRPGYPRLTPPLPFYTALEAYQVALPQVKSWQRDAIIVAIHRGPYLYPPRGALREDGRATSWTFTVASASAEKVTYITLTDDHICVSGHDGHPDEPLRFHPLPLPTDSMLDSSTALSVTLAAGAPGLPASISVGPSSADSDGGPIVPTWLLGYGERWYEDRIVLDAITGEVIESDFPLRRTLVRPNNSLKLTRRAALSELLESPARRA